LRKNYVRYVIGSSFFMDLANCFPRTTAVSSKLTTEQTGSTD
jgi:hypothetical protein